MSVGPQHAAGAVHHARELVSHGAWRLAFASHFAQRLLDQRGQRARALFLGAQAQRFGHGSVNHLELGGGLRVVLERALLRLGQAVAQGQQLGRVHLADVQADPGGEHVVELGAAAGHGLRRLAQAVDQLLRTGAVDALALGLRQGAQQVAHLGAGFLQPTPELAFGAHAMWREGVQHPATQGLDLGEKAAFGRPCLRQPWRTRAHLLHAAPTQAADRAVAEVMVEGETRKPGALDLVNWHAAFLVVRVLSPPNG